MDLNNLHGDMPLPDDDEFGGSCGICGADLDSRWADPDVIVCHVCGSQFSMMANMYVRLDAENVGMGESDQVDAAKVAIGNLEGRQPDGVFSVDQLQVVRELLVKNGMDVGSYRPLFSEVEDLIYNS